MHVLWFECMYVKCEEKYAQNLLNVSINCEEEQ